MNALAAAIADARQSAEKGDIAAVEIRLADAELLVRERSDLITKVSHDLGNLLSIATASVEAMLDGVAPVNEARLNRVRELLQHSSAAVAALSDGALR